MSLIYDPSANNKPGKADALYLDNAVFKQKQNNIKDHESALKLDISALSAQEEIGGTECVGLLIEQWRNVASTCDKFRNFGTEVLDPALGKMMMSINTIDDEAAKSMELEQVLKLNRPGNNAKASFLGDIAKAAMPKIPFNKSVYEFFSGFIQSAGFAFKEASRSRLGVELEDFFDLLFSPSSLLEKMNNTYPTDPFDSLGLYGGNQTSIDPAFYFLGSDWLVGKNDENYEFVRLHEGCENLTDKEVHDLLTEFEKTGCSYIAAVNAILWLCRDQEDLFEKNFGFKMIGENGDLNYIKLAIDYYLDNRCTIFLDAPHALEAMEEYFKKHPVEFYTRFKEYCDQYLALIAEGKIKSSEVSVNEYVYNELIAKGEKVIKTQEDNKGDHSFYNNLSHYTKEKNMGLVLDYYIGEELTEDKIKEALKYNDIVEIRPDKFKLEFEDGSPYFFGTKTDCHSMIVTGIAPDGRYIVSTWGTKLYFNREDCDSIRGFIIKKGPGMTIKMDTEVMSEERANSVKDKLAKDIEHKDFRPGSGNVTKTLDIDVPLPMY